MSDTARLIQAKRRGLRQWHLSLPRPNPTFGNPDWQKADGRVLIVRLSPWRDVERSTPHQLLAGLVRRARPEAFIDFGFFPAGADRALLAEAGAPLIYGVQSLEAAAAFDLVLISNSYGLELINLFRWLQTESIPVRASARTEDFPLFVLGGSNAAACRAVVDEAAADACVDAIYFGEAEAGFARMLPRLLQAGLSRRERLLGARAAGPGLWTVAAPAEPAAPARPLPGEWPSACDTADAYSFSLNGDEAHTVRLEISRGCPSFCSFCFESWDRKPYREIALPALIETARALKRSSGARELELYSFNFNTYAGFFALLPELHRIFRHLNMMSQRVDILARTPSMLEAELAAGKRSYTLGIEGVSERLRRFLAKELGWAAVNQVLRRLLEAGVREIKLFFILTAEESPQDIEEFRTFLRRLRDNRARIHPGCRLVFSFGWLVRMIGTPLQFDRLRLDEADWKFSFSETKCAVETFGFEFRLAMDWDEYRLSQLFALGGGWLFDLADELARAGIVYDGGLGSGAWDIAAARLQGLGRARKTLLGRKGADWPSPMEGILAPVIPRDFLWRRFEQAEACREQAVCFESIDGCSGCGACRDQAEKTAILDHRIRGEEDSQAYLRQLRQLVQAKQLLPARHYIMQVPRRAAGGKPAWIEAWLLRSLLSTAAAAHADAPAGPLELRLLFPKDLANWYGQALVALVSSEAETLAPNDGAFPLALPAGFAPDELMESCRFGCSIQCPDVDPSAVQTALDRRLQQQHLPCTLRRSGARMDFIPSAKAQKKKALWSAHVEAGNEAGSEAAAVQVRLVISRRFDLAGLIAGLDELCAGDGALVRIDGLDSALNIRREP